MPVNATTKSLDHELETSPVIGATDGLEYFQDDYFQKDYFQCELLFYSSNTDKSTKSLDNERETVMLHV